MNHDLYQRRKAKWERLASTWIDTGSPASPSRGDIKNYKQLLEEVLHKSIAARIMILGCTPSLRKMLSEIGIENDLDVTCVDFSAAMYKRTTEFIKHQNPKEKFIMADWLTMDITEKSFDVILGDKVVDNIMPDDWVSFFQRIHTHLRPQGYFIVRLAPQNMALKDVTFTSLLNKWAKSYEHHGNLESTTAGFWEELLGASAFRDGIRYHTQKTERFALDVESIQNNKYSLDKLRKDIFDEFIRVFWSSRGDQWSSYDYDQILEIMGEYFIHDKTLFSTDYEVASLQPLVRMKARNI